MAHKISIPVVYVAGPFRAPTAWEIEQNVRAAESWGMKIAELDAMPLIPHANTRYSQDHRPDQFWIEGTLELLRRCDLLFLIPGWENSEGARGEQLEARDKEIPNTDSWVKLALWVKLLTDGKFDPRGASDLKGTYGL